jgi:hypothetical protein
VVLAQEQDGSLAALLDRRHTDAFLYPGLWNTPSAAVDVDRADDYVRAAAKKIGGKYGVDIAGDAVRESGIVLDALANITTSSGWVVVDAKAVPADVRLERLPLAGFEEFVRKHPSDRWVPSGFLALAEAAIGASKEGYAPEYGEMAEEVVRREYGTALAERPRTTLESLGLK